MANNPNNQVKKSPTTQMGAVYEKYKEKYSGKDTTTSFYFPSDDIPVEEKDEQWCLAWQQALFSLFIRGGAYSTVDEYDKINLLRLYGAGKQPNGIYMNLLLGQNSEGGFNREGWLSTSWEIFSPAPKLHREIRGRLERQEYDYSATAVDPTSNSEKEQQMWEVWYNSKYGEKEKEVMATINAEVEQGTEYIAQSIEELELFKEMGGFKLRSESQLETVLDYTDYISDIKTIKQKVIDDLVDFNKAAYRDVYDQNTGLTTYEYVDWANLIIDVSNEKDFKDIRFWSYIKFETINNVRVNAPWLEEKDLIQMASFNVGWWGNMEGNTFNQYRDYQYKDAKGVRVYDQFRVPVLISEWISTDTEYKTEQTSKAGFKKFYPQEHGKYITSESKKTKVSRVNNVYQSTWIIGSNTVYDHGKSLNSARPNPKKPRLSIHAIAIPGKSITETVKPVYDQIELGWLRRQAAIASTAPPGYDYNISEMEEVSIGGRKMDIWEQIRLHQQTGNTVRRSTALSNDKNSYQGKNTNRNEGGFGEYMRDILADISYNFSLIRELTGIDLVGSALQQGETTATEIKYAGASASDALQPLFTSWVQLKEDSALTASFKIQRAIKYNPVAREAYMGVLGEAGVKVMEIGAESSPAQLGIKLEIRPTAEMKQAAIQAATEALKPGKDGEKINLPDWWYFVNMIERGRAKHAIAILKYRLDKSREQSIQMQRENMQMNGQNALQQQNAKTEGELMGIQAQGMMNIKEAAVKALLDTNVENNKALNDMKMMYIEQILNPQPQGGVPAQEGQVAA